MTTTYNAKETAVFVRAELKQAFPGQKFSIRSDLHTVRVQWTDGPSTDEVSAITKQFSGMHFDGMQDMNEYSDSTYKGEKVRFYCYNPTLNHHYSMDVFKPVVEKIVNKYAIWNNVNLSELNYKESEYSGVYICNAPTDVTNCCYRNLDTEARDELDSISFYTAPTSKPKQARAPKEQPAQAETTAAVTVTENDERDGVEIRFEAKPEQEILESLKEAGFRWSRFNNCWYAKRTADTLAYAASLELQDEPAPTKVEPEMHREMLAIAPAIEQPAPIFCATPVLAMATTAYAVVQEPIAYAPVVFSAQSPQQELKDKLATLNVDTMDAEQISQLLKVLG